MCVCVSVLPVMPHIASFVSTTLHFSFVVKSAASLPHKLHLCQANIVVNRLIKSPRNALSAKLSKTNLSFEMHYCKQGENRLLFVRATDILRAENYQKGTVIVYRTYILGP